MTFQREKQNVSSSELLQAIANGKDLTILSANLHVSRRTAERYLARAIEKLGVRSRLEAVAVALRRGMIQ